MRKMIAIAITVAAWGSAACDRAVAPLSKPNIGKTAAEAMADGSLAITQPAKRAVYVPSGAEQAAIDRLLKRFSPEGQVSLRRSLLTVAPGEIVETHIVGDKGAQALLDSIYSLRTAGARSRRSPRPR
jgi:hypothetical protein